MDPDQDPQSGSKPFDTLIIIKLPIVFSCFFFVFEKSQQGQQKHACKELLGPI